MNELLIQKPMVTESNNLYDCKHGKIVQMDKQGLALRYCTCIDQSTGTDNEWFSGPQCSYKSNVVDFSSGQQNNQVAAIVDPTVIAEQEKK